VREEPRAVSGATESAEATGTTIDVAKVRAQLPATATVAYLNTATCAPLPTVVAHAIAHDAGIELHTGRVDVAGYARAAHSLARLRDQLAALVGAAPADIAVTSGTTSGLNAVVSGHDWRPGDRAVVTTLEHTGALAPLYQARRRYGVEVVLADVGDGEPDRAVDAIAAAVARPGTRLLVVSHVTYGTGARLPLDEIVRLAHDAGVAVLADGAQSVGAVPVDVRAAGVDYFAFAGRKWLFGPEGTGALYVNPARVDELHPLELGVSSFDGDPFDCGAPDGDPFDRDPSGAAAGRGRDDAAAGRDEAAAGRGRDDATAGRDDAAATADGTADGTAAGRDGTVDGAVADDGVERVSARLAAGAARFDGQGGYRPLVAGLSASLRWLGSLGWPAVHATVAARTAYARARAAALPGVRVLTPAGAHAGIVAFALDGVDATACAAFLDRHSVAVRPIPGNRAIRMSFGFFTTTDEIDRAFTLVERFRRR
jgi:selenocysteine lyase/cysteine desulfurase